MNKRIELKRTQKPAELQTAAIAVIVLILLIITGQIIRIVDNFIPANTTMLALLIRIISIIVGAVSVYITWIRNTRIRYYIEDSSLIIQNAGLVGRKAQEIITPKQAPKIILEKTFMGNKLGYGNIIVEVDYFSKKSSYELQYIVDPENAITELRARLK
ncbi:hypothetical protein H6801_04275 [Candidatus Nomurabacteria bacterium]|jgi:uncharacterized membrane protein|nr:hypothetical protein [Candidatus Saccharibacteria bacterium]MCA9312754.1 hypothetical protein [Candidatus Saccharibacteria bacterium]MCB9822550.1 hypothetical protein [Candidatus Nomurabacteria bacterium]MDQ5969878.1 hypothetical protein [Patescibacteria group bacterium]